MVSLGFSITLGTSLLPSRRRSSRPGTCSHDILPGRTPRAGYRPETHRMLVVTDRISIPDDEIQFEFARSGGPGGQNVNKVASKATLRWTPSTSVALPPSVRDRL